MRTFSLLIPTFGRPALLRRLLTYLATQEFPHPIVVADSSIPAVRDENRNTILGHQNLTVVHHVFDPSIEIYKKITLALQSIESDSVGLCSDDDFLAASAPARAIAFLASHPDYIAVQGRSCIIHTHQTSTPISAFPQGSVQTQDPLERLQSYFLRPTSNFYAIYRTPVFKAILARIDQFRTDNTRFEELAVSSLGAVHGNVAILNALHLVRQSSKHRADSGSRSTGGWQEVAKNDSFAKNRELFISMLTRALMDKGIARDMAEASVTKCFDGYIQKHVKKSARDPRSLQERLIALMLSPRQGRLPLVRERVASVMRVHPKMRAISDEYRPIAQLLEQYPDGITSMT